MLKLRCRLGIKIAPSTSLFCYRDCFRGLFWDDRLVMVDYLFTWNLLMPSRKKPTIWLAAAIPALMFASAV